MKFVVEVIVSITFLRISFLLVVTIFSQFYNKNHLNFMGSPFAAKGVVVIAENC